MLRIKRLAISYELLSNMFLDGEHGSYFVDRGIPSDAHLLGVEVAENVIELLFAHPSFPEVLTDKPTFRGPLDLFGIAPEIKPTIGHKD